MLKALVIILLLFVSHVCVADDISEECKVQTTFYVYKDGMVALKNNDNDQAFQIFCSLALQGDDRAQLKLAQLYSHQLESAKPKNMSIAYAWAKLSNQTMVTRRKAKVLLGITSKISEEALEAGEMIYSAIAPLVGTGFRINQKRDDLDLAKIFEEYNNKINKREFTGSNIKRKNPAGSLKAIHVN